MFLAFFNVFVNLMYYPTVCQEGLRKFTKPLITGQPTFGKRKETVTSLTRIINSDH
jgi:hypothetical protein